MPFSRVGGGDRNSRGRGYHDRMYEFGQLGCRQCFWFVVSLHRAARRSSIAYTQRVMYDFEICFLITCDTAEPCVPGILLNDPVGIAQGIWTTANSVLCRDPTN